jgi:hypothetical protein
MLSERQISRDTEERPVTIREVNVDEQTIVAEDEYGSLLQVSLNFNDALVSVPTIGSKWTVYRNGVLWYLGKRGDAELGIGGMEPGDKRIEADGNLHLDAESILINGIDLEDQIQESLDAAIVIAPTTSTRNVILPTAATVTPLTLKGFTGQSAPFLNVTDSADVSLMSVSSTGVLNATGYQVNGVALASSNLSDTANIVLLTGTQTITGAKTFSSPVVASSSVTAGQFITGSNGLAAINLTATTGTPGITIGGDTNLFRSAPNILKTNDTFHVGAQGKDAIHIIDSAAESGITFGTDTNLYRSAVTNRLKTDDELEVVGQLHLGTSGVRFNDGTTQTVAAASRGFAMMMG